MESSAVRVSIKWTLFGHIVLRVWRMANQFGKTLPGWWGNARGGNNVRGVWNLFGMFSLRIRRGVAVLRDAIRCFIEFAKSDLCLTGKGMVVIDCAYFLSKYLRMMLTLCRQMLIIVLLYWHYCIIDWVFDLTCFNLNQIDEYIYIDFIIIN